MSSTDAHNEHQRSYFTGRDLPRMDPRARTDTPYTRRHVDALVDALGLTAPASVIDVGCGPGKYTLGLAARGLQVEGLDLTPALLDDLATVAPELPTHVADLADPPAELHGRFDAATGFFVLHHVPDVAAALRGVRAMLVDGGRAGFVEPNPRFPGYYAQVSLTPGMSWKGEKGILKMRRGVFRRAAAEAGFTDLSVTAFGAFPPALANQPLGARVEAAIESIPGWSRVAAFRLVTMRAR